MAIDWDGAREDVAAAVKRVIDGCGLSGRQIAKRCQTTVNTVSRWRMGRALPRTIAGRQGVEALLRKILFDAGMNSLWVLAQKLGYDGFRIECPGRGDIIYASLSGRIDTDFMIEFEYCVGAPPGKVLWMGPRSVTWEEIEGEMRKAVDLARGASERSISRRDAEARRTAKGFDHGDTGSTGKSGRKCLGIGE